MPLETIPQGLRVAVYNAMGGWGPYSVREICELFNTYGFYDTADDVGDVGGARRSTAEEFQRRIDWSDAEQRRRYLMLVADVLEHYPDEDGRPSPHRKAVMRALRLAGAALPAETPDAQADSADDLWTPPTAIRIFFSHLSDRKHEVHELARLLQKLGFSCFVAHDQIQPSRAWLHEIERALRTCDILVAYVSPKFRASQWTDQEVGWALGRELIAIPVGVDGENPRGFLGSEQAIKRRAAQSDVELARDIFSTIVDAVFAAQRLGAARLSSRIAPLIANAFSRSTSYENTRLWHRLLLRIPTSLWSAGMYEQVEIALEGNRRIRDAALDGGDSLPDAVRADIFASLPPSVRESTVGTAAPW